MIEMEGNSILNQASAQVVRRSGNVDSGKDHRNSWVVAVAVAAAVVDSNDVDSIDNVYHYRCNTQDRCFGPADSCGAAALPWWLRRRLAQTLVDVDKAPFILLVFVH
jgi:hypothetical protein